MRNASRWRCLASIPCAAAYLMYFLRKQDSRKEFPGFGRHKLTKADLPNLTKPEFFEYVRRHYARGRIGRAAAAVTDAARKLVS